MSFHLVAGTLLGLTLSTTAFAQSFTAPAGIPAVTAPGGVEGRAAAPNLAHSRNVGGYGPVYEDGVAITGSIRRPHDGRFGYVR